MAEMQWLKILVLAFLLTLTSLLDIVTAQDVPIAHITVYDSTGCQGTVYTYSNLADTTCHTVPIRVGGNPNDQSYTASVTYPAGTSYLCYFAFYRDSSCGTLAAFQLTQVTPTSGTTCNAITDPVTDVLDTAALAASCLLPGTECGSMRLTCGSTSSTSTAITNVENTIANAIKGLLPQKRPRQEPTVQDPPMKQGPAIRPRQTPVPVPHANLTTYGPTDPCCTNTTGIFQYPFTQNDTCVAAPLYNVQGIGDTSAFSIDFTSSPAGYTCSLLLYSDFICKESLTQEYGPIVNVASASRPGPRDGRRGGLNAAGSGGRCVSVRAPNGIPGFPFENCQEAFKCGAFRYLCWETACKAS